MTAPNAVETASQIQRLVTLGYTVVEVTPPLPVPTEV